MQVPFSIPTRLGSQHQMGLVMERKHQKRKDASKKWAGKLHHLTLVNKDCIWHFTRFLLLVPIRVTLILRLLGGRPLGLGPVGCWGNEIVLQNFHLAFIAKRDNRPQLGDVVFHGLARAELIIYIVMNLPKIKVHHHCHYVPHCAKSSQWRHHTTVISIHYIFKKQKRLKWVVRGRQGTHLHSIQHPATGNTQGLFYEEDARDWGNPIRHPQRPPLVLRCVIFSHWTCVPHPRSASSCVSWRTMGHYSWLEE